MTKSVQFRVQDSKIEFLEKVKEDHKWITHVAPNFEKLLHILY